MGSFVKYLIASNKNFIKNDMHIDMIKPRPKTCKGIEIAVGICTYLLFS